MKKMLILTLMALFCMTLAVYAGGTQEANAEEGEITLYAAAGLDVYGESWDKFYELYPNIKINHIKTLGSGESWDQKVTTAILGGEDVDIAQQNPNAYYNLASKGYFEDLRPYMEKDGLEGSDLMGSYSEVILQPRGKIDGFLWEVSPWLMFYNKQYMDDAGLPYPELGWTWDDFEDYLAALTKGEGADKVFGYYGHTWDICLSLFGIEAAKGEWFTDDGKCNIKSPEWQKGIKYYKGLIDKGYAVPISDMQSLKMHYSGTFLSGQSAMTYNGAWVFQYIRDKERFPHDFTPGITSLPIPDKSYPKNYTTGAPGAGVLVANSKKKELAWTFIKYYTTNPDNQILTAAKMGGLATYVPKGREEELFAAMLNGTGVTVKDAEALTTPWVYFNEKPIGEVGSVYGRIIEEELPLYYNGNRDLASTLDLIEKRVNEEIEKAKM